MERIAIQSLNTLRGASPKVAQQFAVLCHIVSMCQHFHPVSVCGGTLVTSRRSIIGLHVLIVLQGHVKVAVI